VLRSRGGCAPGDYINRGQLPVGYSEDEQDEVFDVIRKATDAVAEYGSRVSLVVKADIRPGHTGELTGKVERLNEALR